MQPSVVVKAPVDSQTYSTSSPPQFRWDENGSSAEEEPSQSWYSVKTYVELLSRRVLCNLDPHYVADRCQVGVCGWSSNCSIAFLYNDVAAAFPREPLRCAYAGVLPRDLRRVARRGQRDRQPVHHQPLVSDLHATRKDGASEVRGAASAKHRENFSSNPRSSLLDLDGAIETAVHGVVLKLVLHVLRGHRRVDVLDDELRVIHGNARHLTRDHRESDNHGRNTSAAKADTRRPLRNSPGEPPDCPLFGPSAPRRSSWPRTWRPMRPKPLMPSFTGASGLVDLR